MLAWLYNLFLLPLLLPYLAWRLSVLGKSREGLSQRLGRVPDLGPAPPTGRIWVHAVSVGETVAAIPIVAALRKAMPEGEILFSTTTPTGQAQARRSFPDAVLHFYFPLDLPWVVRRVLQRLRPSALVLVEAEIWPNLLAAARQRDVPVIVANAHLSDRTFRRAARLRRLLAPLFEKIAAYLAQSMAVRERILALGMPAERVLVMGHTKFDQDLPLLTPEERCQLRASLGLDTEQPLLLAGSTHEGEEELVLDAWDAACRAVPSLALMLAPRHPARVPEVRALIERRGLTVLARSETGHMPPRGGARTPDRPRELRNAVLLLDTMGELARFYGLATIAFVGGSLVPKGGHDILQPLFHGVPTLFGPHMHNQRTLASIVLGAGAAVEVAGAAGLAEAVPRLLEEGEARSRMRIAAARLLAENRGAAARCAAIVAQLVRSPEEHSILRLPLGDATTGPFERREGSEQAAGSESPCAISGSSPSPTPTDEYRSPTSAGQGERRR